MGRSSNRQFEERHRYGDKCHIDATSRSKPSSPTHRLTGSCLSLIQRYSNDLASAGFAFHGRCGASAQRPSRATLRRISVAYWILEYFDCELASKLRIVLRAKPVRFAISCSDILSRKYIRRILPKISMVITLFSPAYKLGRTSGTPRSILSRHNSYRRVSIRSAATPRCS
jgi:hypothetical protein